MNEDMTLRELRKLTGVGCLNRVPGKEILKETGRMVAFYWGGDIRISVYDCGYAIAEAKDRWTVFNIGDCGRYEYDAGDDMTILEREAYTFEAEYFMELPWTVSLMLTAEDRLEANNESRERGLISEHPDEPGPRGRLWSSYTSVEEEAIRRIRFDVAMSSLTEKQRESMELWMAGFTYSDIARRFMISHQSARGRMEGAFKKFQRNY